jgi:hypothetical protein
MRTADEFRDGDFLATFPLLVLVGDLLLEPGTGAFRLVDAVAVEVEGSPCLAVFTDTDLAERFARRQGQPAAPKIAVFDRPADFVTFLEGLDRGACPGIAFDPGGVSGQVVRATVEQVIRDFRGASAQ